MFIIDRFKGEWAVIEFGDGFIHLPISLLPTGTKVGDVLKIRLEVDRHQTEERKKRIAVLMDELFED